MWNYTKGTEADFEGAPDSATVRLKGVRPHYFVFADAFEYGSCRTDTITGEYDSVVHAVDEWKLIAQRERVAPTQEQIKRDIAENVSKITQNSGGVEQNITVRIGSGLLPGVHSNDTQSLIAERGSRYGAFSDGSAIMQQLKQVMHDTPNWNNLSSSQKEALDMIQHKIGRILNGDPDYDDNWKDIAGYSTLVADELNGVKR